MTEFIDFFIVVRWEVLLQLINGLLGMFHLGFEFFFILGPILIVASI